VNSTDVSGDIDRASYNFRAGKTFSYGGGGPKGLLSNKRLIVITASGGEYSTEPAKSLDFLEPYIRTIMNFIGTVDITFIKAHGIDAETISRTTQAATASIDAFFQPMSTMGYR
jgi:FMN-dependent NADH-azoreductase